MPPPIPPQRVELRSGRLRAELRPDVGGCLTGLWWDETPVLRSRPALQLDSPRQAACYAMLPYSNRIGHGHLQWNGLEATLARNFGEHPHPLHGFGWQSAWQAQLTDAGTVAMKLSHTPDARWPFAMQAEQVIRLDSAVGATSGAALHACVTLTNTDHRIQPMGFGWHPYFLRREHAHAGGTPPAPPTYLTRPARLQAAVTARWAKNASALPTHLEPVDALDAPVDQLALDHGFEGWDGLARIEDEVFSLRLRSSLRRLVVFTPAPTTESAHFCVEPVSHASNALQMADPIAQGLVAVPPGQSIDGWMRLEIEPGLPHRPPALP